MPHFLALKLLTGFEEFGPPVNDFGDRVVILDGASVVQIFKGIGISTVQ